MFSFFRRRKPSFPLPPVLDTWRPGDMAECVVDTGQLEWRSLDAQPVPTRAPQLGTRALVLSVRGEGDTTCLRLLGFERWWHASAFRKIAAPDCAAERSDSAPRPVPEQEVA